MPFFLVTIGLLMIVSGARDTYSAFGKQLVSDFTGPQNFTYWLVALGALGFVGYAPQLRSFSRAFMALVIIAMVLANGGVFAKFTQALQQGPVRPGDNAKPVGGSSTSDPVNITVDGGNPAKPSVTVGAHVDIASNALNDLEHAATVVQAITAFL